MTLGDLLLQDGAFALLAIGAALGFFAGLFFRARRAGGKGISAPETAQEAASPAVSYAPAPVPAPGPARPEALVAAIAAAVSKYQTENR